METQHLYPTAVRWLNCRPKQTIDYVILQTSDPFHQSFYSWTGWNNENFEHTKSLDSSSVGIFFPRCKSLFLQSCPKKFIRFFCEVKVYLLKGNLQGMKRHHATNFQTNVWLISLKNSLGSKEESLWHPKNGYNSYKYLLFPSVTICLDMEQFVLVPFSVYYNNKSLKTKAVTKQGLLMYQVEQNPKKRIDSLKKEKNKKLFAKADSLVDKIFSCPRIKLWNSQTLWMVGVETGVLLSGSAQQLRRRNADVTDIYLILLDAAGISGSESKCQIQRQRKLGLFQKLNVRSCKDCTHRVVLLMGVCAT